MLDSHYRDRLTQADVADPILLLEVRAALDDLNRLLDLGLVYRFKQ
ncbi:N-succinylarginine dihydrolase [Erwinia amylovora]